MLWRATFARPDDDPFRRPDAAQVVHNVSAAETRRATVQLAITVAELLVGVALAKGKRRARRQAFVDAILETVPVLPYQQRVAHAHAGLLTSVRRSGRPRGAHDLVIAATAVASDRIVITADASGFHDLPGLDYRQHPAED